MVAIEVFCFFELVGGLLLLLLPMVHVAVTIPMVVLLPGANVHRIDRQHVYGGDSKENYGGYTAPHEIFTQTKVKKILQAANDRFGKQDVSLV